MEDKQLEQLAKRLGAKAADGLDVEKTADAVLERLATETTPTVWWRRIPRLSAVAAAAVLLLAIGILADNGGDSPDEADSDLVPMPLELQALSDNELEEVFDSLSFDAPVSELATASLEEMSVGQLEDLLQTMMED